MSYILALPQLQGLVISVKLVTNSVTIKNSNIAIWI